MRAIGLDVGGTAVKGVVVDEGGRVCAEDRVASAVDPPALVANMRRLLAALRPAAEDGDLLGLATAGMPHADGRRVEFCPGDKLRLVGIDWSQALGWPRPVPLVNDANAALLGEAWVGAAVGARHVLLLTLGTGVGGGVLADGRLLRGSRGRAGHLGHISLFPEGGPSILGMPGSLEDAIGEQTVGARSGGRFRSTADLVRAFQAGDADAARVWLASVNALARGIASLVNVLDPEMVLVGGGIANAGDALFGPLAAALERVEYRPDGQGVPVRAAALGDRAGAIGAARLALLER